MFNLQLLPRRLNGITKGTHCGRPCKQHLEHPDESTQTKRSRKEHTKRKHNLRQNQLKNRANQHFWPY